jgi:DNA polymerase
MMFGGAKDTIESYLGWWQSAGYELPVSNDRRDWLAPAAAAKAVESSAHLEKPKAVEGIRPAPPAPVAAAPIVIDHAGPLPATVEAFDHWWMHGDDAPGAIPGTPRLAPSGAGEASLMVLTDCPDAEDVQSGKLFAGRTGDLLDAMLAAIGLARSDVRLSALIACRPPGGLIDPSSSGRLGQIARHQIKLVRPKALLILGQNAMRTIESVDNPSGKPQFNQDGGNVVVHGIHHPRLLIERPLLKRQAWESLKQLRTIL